MTTCLNQENEICLNHQTIESGKRVSKYLTSNDIYLSILRQTDVQAYLMCAEMALSQARRTVAEATQREYPDSAVNDTALMIRIRNLSFALSALRQEANPTHVSPDA